MNFWIGGKLGTISKAIKKARHNLKNGHNSANNFDTETLSDPHGIGASDNGIEDLDIAALRALSKEANQLQTLEKTIPFPEEYQIKLL